jgi:hypothetical protein
MLDDLTDELKKKIFSLSIYWTVEYVYSSFLSDGIYFRTILDVLAGVRLICIHLYFASFIIGF